jgi:4-amino-4-deoxy-L-arabinose transferase-like glycosyltransferase
MKPSLLVVVVIAAYLAFVVPQLGRPLMYDDANFALGAKAVVDTGLPFGNQGWMSDRGDVSHREQWALWHPPLYIYALGGTASLGGWTPPVLRLLGIAGGMTTGFVTWLLARKLTRGPPPAKDLAAAAALVVTLLCPLVIQSTLVLDVDFAMLLPLSLTFLLAYLNLEKAPKSWLWLAPFFAVLLWAKMTNPLALITVAVAWQLMRGSLGRAAVHLGAIGLGGAAIFGVSWLAIGLWLRFPLDMPFGVNLAEWQDSAEVARRAYTSLGAFVEGLQPSVLWIGPGLVALGLSGVAVRTAQLARCWRMHETDLLVGVAAALVFGYVNKSAGWFPKYQVALVPLLACIGAPLVAHAWCARPRLTTGVGLFAAAASAAVTTGLVRDHWALERTWAIEPLAAGGLLTILAIAALVGVRWRAAAPTALAGLLGLALGWSLAVDVIQVQAPYQTDYWYGTRGTLAAAAWVNANLTPDETYLASKEVAIASDDLRYVDQDDVLYLVGTGHAFEGKWYGEPLYALVTWQRDAYIANLFSRAASAAGFHESARFGDYVVYVPS